MKNLSREEAVILGLLWALNHSVLRTKFVKLMYLLDNYCFEQTGSTMTDITYHWDHYGPNAVGNAITDLLSILSKKGLARQTSKMTSNEE